MILKDTAVNFEHGFQNPLSQSGDLDVHLITKVDQRIFLKTSFHSTTLGTMFYDLKETIYQKNPLCQMQNGGQLPLILDPDINHVAIEKFSQILKKGKVVFNDESEAQNVLFLVELFRLQIEFEGNKDSRPTEDNDSLFKLKPEFTNNNLNEESTSVEGHENPPLNTEENAGGTSDEEEAEIEDDNDEVDLHETIYGDTKEPEPADIVKVEFDDSFNEEEETFDCKFAGCLKKFHDVNGLKTHLRIHYLPKSHQCDICNKAFAEANKLKRHLLVHTGSRPFKCRSGGCEKEFSLKFNRKTHEQLHTGEKPYKCTICEKAFVQKCNLKAHELTHNSHTKKNVSESQKS